MSVDVFGALPLSYTAVNDGCGLESNQPISPLRADNPRLFSPMYSTTGGSRTHNILVLNQAPLPLGHCGRRSCIRQGFSAGQDRYRRGDLPDLYTYATPLEFPSLRSLRVVTSPHMTLTRIRCMGDSLVTCEATRWEIDTGGLEPPTYSSVDYCSIQLSYVSRMPLGVRCRAHREDFSLWSSSDLSVRVMPHPARVCQDFFLRSAF